MKDYNEIKTKPASEIFDIINTFKNDHRKRVAITEASGYFDSLRCHCELE